MPAPMGRLFCALVSEAQAAPWLWNPAAHAREDLVVFSAVVEQSEGEFPRAVLTVPRPTGPLLSEADRVGVLLSVEMNGAPVFVFAGRLVGFPTAADDATVAMTFLGQPPGADATRAAFIQSLRVLPFYEPLASVEARADDPQQVLAARSALFHWSRLTGTLSLSDILTGGSSVAFDDSQILDETVKVDVGEPPPRRVQVVVRAEWEQQHAVSFDLAPRIRSRFGRDGMSTLTPESFEQEWPQSGGALGDNTGYTVVYSSLTRDRLRSGTLFFPEEAPVALDAAEEPSGDPAVDEDVAIRIGGVPRVWYRGRLDVLAEYRQKRREVITALITHGIQEIAPDDGRSEVVEVNLGDVAEDRAYPLWRPGTAYASGDIVAWGGWAWRCLVTHLSSGAFQTDASIGRWERLVTTGSAIGWVGEPTYFGLPRGAQSFHHGLLRARALLAKSSRCVTIAFEVPITAALGITLDHSVALASSRVPGGSATGKVTAYRLSWGGDGATSAEITIGCAIGTGASNPAPGAGQVGVGGIVYTNPTLPIFQPIDTRAMSRDYLVEEVKVINGGEEQSARVRLAGTIQAAEEILDQNRTSVEVRMRPLAAYPEITLTVAAGVPTPWHPPKGVDLS